MEKRKLPVVQLSLLGLLLVVAPLGSYIYLKLGYDYRVESLSELIEVGPVANLGLSAALDKREVGVYFSGEGLRNGDSAAVSLKQVHDAFNEQPLVQFRSLVSPAESIISDAVQFKPLGSREAIAAFGRLSATDQHCARVPVAQRAIVADTSGMVRRCYDLHQGQQVARLVEHLTILVPRPEKEDIFIERESEL